MCQRRRRGPWWRAAPETTKLALLPSICPHQTRNRPEATVDARRVAGAFPQVRRHLCELVTSDQTRVFVPEQRLRRDAMPGGVGVERSLVPVRVVLAPACWQSPHSRRKIGTFASHAAVTAYGLQQRGQRRVSDDRVSRTRRLNRSQENNDASAANARDARPSGSATRPPAASTAEA